MNEIIDNYNVNSEIEIDNSELEKYPYATIDYEMFKECIYPYTNIKQINQERMRILMHMNAIKSDCDALAMDVEKTLRIRDTSEEDDFSPLTGRI